MSVRSATGHYFATGSSQPASLTSWTLYGIAKVNADLGASVQLLAAMTFDGGDGTATALYWDATADDMLVLSLDAGTPIGGGTGTFGSRPPVGDWFKWYKKTNGTTTTAGWKNISNPAAWVNVSCTALNAEIATWNATELTSNSNPCSSDHEVWRCDNGDLSEAAIDADLDLSISALTSVFDWRLFLTSNLVEYTGSGSTLTSQGGSLSNGDSFNSFPGDLVGSASLGDFDPLMRPAAWF
jgi:hypothetical protein